MTSSVFFKFKSQKEPTRVEFDGTGISVFELKREIIIASGLGDGTEFDLAIYTEDGKEEYDDDTTIIPRSTTVVARRLPPLKPGAGRAARYMTGKAPVNAKNSSRREAPTAKSTTRISSATAPAPRIDENMTEEERMAAMFAVQNEQWSAAQNEMASQAPVFRPGAKKGQPNAHVPDHEPPAGYICYRCGEKGHWIQVCPTNDDPNFDNKPRVKRTTGIPRSFLKTVEKPVASANDGTEDDTKAPSGVMVNAEGEFVVAEPDKASWEQFQAKTKSSAAAEKAASSGNKELQERGLECSIDKRMFIDPMKTPCCEKTYCNDCITNALIESDFTCPNCQTDEVLIDNLKPDEEMNAKIKKYLEESKASQKPKSPSKSPTPQNVTTQQSVGSPQSKREGSLAPVSQEQHNSPSPQRSSAKPDQNRGANRATSEAPGPQTKKRPADVLLDDPKIPKAPRAMQQQQGPQQGQRQSQFHNNGMNNMSNPNMPFDMSQFGGNMFNPMMINGFGMPGMPMMGRNPNMMNPMMLPNGFPMQGGGYPPMNMQGMGMPYGPGGYGNNMNGGNGNFLDQRQNNGGAPAGNGQFANQQKNNFAGPTPAEEDNPYFRNPVNPHRHQGRQKRQRPSDYREL